MDESRIESNLNTFGWRLVSDQEPGFVGGRKLVQSLETGEHRMADIVNSYESITTHSLGINAAFARNWSEKYTTSFGKGGWLDLEDMIGYEILSIDQRARRLSTIPRTELTSTPNEAWDLVLKLYRCLEYITLCGACHLAICPDSIYITDAQVRVGEPWYHRHSDGRPIFNEYVFDKLIIDAIPTAARRYAAPEVLNYHVDNSALASMLPAHPSMIKFGPEIDPYLRLLEAPPTREELMKAPTEQADIYSFALLALYIFAGYEPDRSIEDAPDRAGAIQRLSSEFDEEIARDLSEALDPDWQKRPPILGIKNAISFFAERRGMTLPPTWWHKAR